MTLLLKNLHPQYTMSSSKATKTKLPDYKRAKDCNEHFSNHLQMAHEHMGICTHHHEWLGKCRQTKHEETPPSHPPAQPEPRTTSRAGERVEKPQSTPGRWEGNPVRPLWETVRHFISWPHTGPPCARELPCWAVPPGDEEGPRQNSGANADRTFPHSRRIMGNNKQPGVDCETRNGI